MPSMIAYPLLRGHLSSGVFAWRSGQPISVETFLNDVAALADLLPPRRYMINLSPDRYRFAVGFAAALARKQINVLPPHDAPALFERLKVDCPDIYCLTDESAAPGDIPVFAYPSALVHGRKPAPLPIVAASLPAAVLFTSGSTGLPRPHARSWGE